MRKLVLFSLASIPLCTAYILSNPTARSSVPLALRTTLPKSTRLPFSTRRVSRLTGFGITANIGGILGGFASVLRGGMMSAATVNQDDPLAPWQDTAPSWDELKRTLDGLQTPEEKRFRADLAAGRGSANSLATIRLFDAPDGTEPRVVLYRDFAAWCPYCEKVSLCRFLF